MAKNGVSLIGGNAINDKKSNLPKPGDEIRTEKTSGIGFPNIVRKNKYDFKLKITGKSLHCLEGVEFDFFKFFWGDKSEAEKQSVNNSRKYKLASIRKAANEGDVEAQLQLAKIFILKESDEWYKESVIWLEKAADKNNEHAQLYLATILAFVLGRYAESLKHFRKLSAHGDKLSKKMYKLLNLLIGKNKNVHDLINEANQAINMEESNKAVGRALYILGLCQYCGVVTGERNIEKACELFDKAQKFGVSDI